MELEEVNNMTDLIIQQKDLEGEKLRLQIAIRDQMIAEQSEMVKWKASSEERGAANENSGGGGSRSSSLVVSSSLQVDEGGLIGSTTGAEALTADPSDPIADHDTGPRHQSPHTKGGEASATGGATGELQGNADQSGVLVTSANRWQSPGRQGLHLQAEILQPDAVEKGKAISNGGIAGQGKRRPSFSSEQAGGSSSSGAVAWKELAEMRKPEGWQELPHPVLSRGGIFAASRGVAAPAAEGLAAGAEQGPLLLGGSSSTTTTTAACTQSQLTDNLRRNITKHMVGDTEDASRQMVTMLASRIKQIGCQILTAFPPDMREMKVRDVWRTLSVVDKKGLVNGSSCRGAGASSGVGHTGVGDGRGAGAGPAPDSQMQKGTTTTGSLVSAALGSGGGAATKTDHAHAPPTKPGDQTLTPALDEVKFMSAIGIASILIRAQQGKMSILSGSDLRGMVFEFVCKSADIIHCARVPARSDGRKGKKNTSFQFTTFEESSCRNLLASKAGDFFGGGGGSSSLSTSMSSSNNAEMKKTNLSQQVLVFDVFEAESGAVRRTSSTLSKMSQQELAASQQSVQVNKQSRSRVQSTDSLVELEGSGPSPDDCETVRTETADQESPGSPPPGLLLGQVGKSGSGGSSSSTAPGAGGASTSSTWHTGGSWKTSPRQMARERGGPGGNKRRLTASWDDAEDVSMCDPSNLDVSTLSSASRAPVTGVPASDRGDWGTSPELVLPIGSGGGGDPMGSTLTLRRLDERVFRKLATACRSLFVLTRILPSFHMFRRKIPLYMHCYFADPNVVMCPVPEELLTVPSSVGTLTLSLARGRQPRTQPPVVAAGRNLRGSHLMGTGSSSLGEGLVGGCRASDGIIVEEGYMLDGVSRIGRSAGEPGTQLFQNLSASWRSDQFEPVSGAGGGSCRALGPNASSFSGSSSGSTSIRKEDGRSSYDSVAGPRDKSSNAQIILPLVPDARSSPTAGYGSTVEMEMHILESDEEDMVPGPTARRITPPEPVGRMQVAKLQQVPRGGEKVDPKDLMIPATSSSSEQVGHPGDRRLLPTSTNAAVVSQTVVAGPSLTVVPEDSEEAASSSKRSSAWHTPVQSKDPCRGDESRCGGGLGAHQSGEDEVLVVAHHEEDRDPIMRPGTSTTTTDQHVAAGSPTSASRDDDPRFDLSPLLRELNPFLGDRKKEEIERTEEEDSCKKYRSVVQEFLAAAKALPLDEIFSRSGGAAESGALTGEEMEKRLKYYRGGLGGPRLYAVNGGRLSG
eukprot:g15142.t1